MGCKCDNCGGRITGLAHIGIRVSDMDASLKFYVDTLGFTMTDDHRMPAVRLTFINIGNCLIELIQPADYAPREAGSIDHIAMEVEDIDSLVCRLIEKQVPFLSGEIKQMDIQGGVKNIFLTGPDGERIEFFEHLNR